VGCKFEELKNGKIIVKTKCEDNHQGTKKTKPGKTSRQGREGRKGKSAMRVSLGFGGCRGVPSSKNEPLPVMVAFGKICAIRSNAALGR